MDAKEKIARRIAQEIQNNDVVNLGIGLAKEGKKVLLKDADPQGSLTISMA